MRTFFYLAVLLFPALVCGQDSIQRKGSVSGYVTNMQSFMFQRWDGDWISDNLIHNRLNFTWYNTANTLSAKLEIRNRFITGESVKNISGYAKSMEADPGFFNLTSNFSAGRSYILNAKIDRVYLDYTRDKFQVRIGRQRINWSQCFTWNPNDLFNAYSFFDFDYTEKTGSDAVRLQYYTSSTSTFELAVKANNHQKITTAALWRFNKWNYDIQFLGGYYNEEDYVLGTGWSGNILGASFRGELSYFHPQKQAADTVGTVVISLGSEYSFKNSLLLLVEVLYNNHKSSGITSFTDYYSMDFSAKNLSFSDVSLMVQGSYPVTPLFNASLAGMYFPSLRGMFVGPSLSWSLTRNIDFSLITQSFAGQLQKGKTEYFHLGFLRLKACF